MYLITDQPFWEAWETGFGISTEYDPIGSDPDFQALNSMCKLGQDGGAHITI